MRRLTPAAVLLIAACAVVPDSAPPPAGGPATQRAGPLPRPAPPAPPAVQSPAPADWADAPVAPGQWFYRSDATGSRALFGQEQGQARISFACTGARRIELSVAVAQPAGIRSIVLRATTAIRQLPASPLAGPVPGVGASLDPRDPILDAIAFSRGRFAVELGGAPTQRIVLPSWPEVARVVEDCRS